MTGIDELRPLTAMALLDIRCSTAQGDWDGEELALRRNAAVLATCCFWENERAFDDAEAVLRQLTVPQMEALLTTLLHGGGTVVETEEGAVSGFDEVRFCALRRENGWTI